MPGYGSGVQLLKCHHHCSSARLHSIGLHNQGTTRYHVSSHSDRTWLTDQPATKNTTATLCGEPIRDETHIVSYAGVIGCVIAVVAYLLRMISKVSFPCEGAVKVINNLWWDDAVATFAMAEIIALSAFSVVLADLGLGKDIWTLSPTNITHILKVSITMLNTCPAHWLTLARSTTLTKICT